MSGSADISIDPKNENTWYVAVTLEVHGRQLMLGLPGLL